MPLKKNTMSWISEETNCSKVAGGPGVLLGPHTRTDADSIEQEMKGVQGEIDAALNDLRLLSLRSAEGRHSAWMAERVRVVIADSPRIRR